MGSENTPKFIRKLTKMLDDDNNQRVIGWLESGEGFQIKHLQQFEDCLLPMYYRHRKMSSFIRQLNMYGFHKIRAQGISCYKHEMFVRDKQELMTRITRKAQKKVSSASLSEHEKDDVLGPQIEGSATTKDKPLSRLVKQQSEASQKPNDNRLSSVVSLKCQYSNIPDENFREKLQQSVDAEEFVERVIGSQASISFEIENSTKNKLFWGPSQILDV